MRKRGMIDPGYGTQGAVIVEVAIPLRVIAAKSWKYPSMPKDTKRADREARNYAVLADLHEFLAPHAGEIESFAIEEWIGGDRNPHVAYWRGRYDEALKGYLRGWGCPVRSWRPGIVKAMCHPSGKAMDKGREKTPEFLNALSQLDKVFDPSSLALLQDPEHNAPRRWKQARLHTLDAAALGAFDVLFEHFDPSTGRPAHWDFTEAQGRLVERVADE